MHLVNICTQSHIYSKLSALWSHRTVYCVLRTGRLISTKWSAIGKLDFEVPEKLIKMEQQLHSVNLSAVISRLLLGIVAIKLRPR